jgi:hypothetical protein
MPSKFIFLYTYSYLEINRDRKLNGVTLLIIILHYYIFIYSNLLTYL